MLIDIDIITDIAFDIIEQILLILILIDIDVIIVHLILSCTFEYAVFCIRILKTYLQIDLVIKIRL